MALPPAPDGRLRIDAPLVLEADVIVVGSGSAGSSAAIAAARGGASVVLIEKQGFLGGISTAVLDTFYGFYTPGSRSLKIAGGIPDDVVDGLRALGPVVERPNTYGAGTGVTYNSEHLKLVWERLATEAGVRVLLHAFVQDVVVAEGRVLEVLVATKAGLARVAGTVFVDASGDADLVHHAGFGYELAGAQDPAQTLTTTFRMVNVDISARKSMSTSEMHELMGEAADSGEYDLPRREGSDHITPVEGMIATVMTRLPSYRERDGQVINATDPELLAEAEILGRRQAVEYARFLRDKVPGYENASLVALSAQIGVRETRRVYGDYRLTRDDVLGARRFDDEVGLCGAPIEDHHPGADTKWQYLPDGEVVGIPYRSLLVRDSANTLVAGRCFSATHDAHASVRSMAQTMSMGQAAGTAAALAAGSSIDPRALDTGALRDRLRDIGAVLEPPA
ncbi:MAG: FAD-dependent oxidoreductase [Candidatus Limnocylindrales bacterium]